MIRTLVVVLVLALAAVAGWALLRSGDAAAEAPSLAIARGTVVKKAVASGQVEPIQETQVNTQLGGFVRTLHAPLGAQVRAGDPLCEVWPALTEQDLLRAERGLMQAREGEEAAQEFVRGDHLLAGLTRFVQGERNLERMKKSAERGRRSAEEALELLRKGQVEIDGRIIDFVVRAPVAGHVLQVVRRGDPITPASSFGLGTVVAVIGDLDQPVFRGTVDEIDVGRLKKGMAARVTLGALPDADLAGTVQERSLSPPAVALGHHARREARLRIRLPVPPRLPGSSTWCATSARTIASGGAGRSERCPD